MDSGSNRNTAVLGEDFVRRLVAEAFSRSMVEHSERHCRVRFEILDRASFVLERTGVKVHSRFHCSRAAKANAGARKRFESQCLVRHDRRH